MALNGLEAHYGLYRADGIDQVKAAGKDKEPKLSKEAEKYLKELKKKYTDMDFTIASYSNDQEAREYLSKGDKDYSVLIDPETLEEMAKDPKVRDKYEAVLDQARPDFEKFKEQLGEDAEFIKSFGISIDGDGQISYLATLMEDKIPAGQKEDKSRHVSSKEPGREKTVKAASLKELLDKIRQVKDETASENLRTEEERARGGNIDIMM